MKLAQHVKELVLTPSKRDGEDVYDADQQKKFTEIRDQYRRQLIEKMGSTAIQKAEAKVKQEM